MKIDRERLTALANSAFDKAFPVLTSIYAQGHAHNYTEGNFPAQFGVALVGYVAGRVIVAVADEVDRRISSQPPSPQA